MVTPLKNDSCLLYDVDEHVNPVVDTTGNLCLDAAKCTVTKVEL